MTTRARLALQAERPTYDLNRHETYAMVTTDDARKLLALVEAVGELLESLKNGDANDCGYAVSILTEKYDTLTTDPEARDG